MKKKLTHRFDGQVFCRLGQGARAKAYAQRLCRPPLPLRQGAGALERECGDEVCAATARFWQGSGRAGMSHRSARATSMPSVRDKHESAWRRAWMDAATRADRHSQDADGDRLARADPAGTATVVVRSLASNHASVPEVPACNLGEPGAARRKFRPASIHAVAPGEETTGKGALRQRRRGRSVCGFKPRGLRREHSWCGAQ